MNTPPPTRSRSCFPDNKSSTPFFYFPKLAVTNIFRNVFAKGRFTSTFSAQCTWSMSVCGEPFQFNSSFWFTSPKSVRGWRGHSGAYVHEQFAHKEKLPQNLQMGEKKNLLGPRFVFTWSSHLSWPEPNTKPLCMFLWSQWVCVCTTAT